MRGGGMRGSAGLLCLALLGLAGQARAGTFLSANIRWVKKEGNQVSFDVATYWKRSFSPFKDGAAQPGDIIDLIAQNTVQFAFGDGTTEFLQGVVTNVNVHDDWLEAVSTVTHTYAQPFKQEHETGPQYTPWTASLTGCCRSSTLRNDGDGKFFIAASINLALAMESPDPRVPPKVFVKEGGAFQIAAPVPSLTPASARGAVSYSLCPFVGTWTLPAGGEVVVVDANTTKGVVLDGATGEMAWRLPTNPTGQFHVCVQIESSGVWTQTDFEVVSLAAATVVPTVSAGYELVAFVGYRAGNPAPFTLTATLPGASGTVGFTVGYRSRFEDGAPSATGGVLTTVAAGDSATVSVEYLVPSWTLGWVAMCFSAYDTANPSVSSSPVCINFLSTADSAPTLTATAASEFALGPTRFRVREGQELRVNFNALIPPLDANVQISLEPVHGLSGALVEGISIAHRITGNNASSDLVFVPPRAMAGAHVEACVQAVGQAGEYRRLETRRMCVVIEVQRCQWTVQEAESMVTIAAETGVSWLQLWNFNKGVVTRPDFDLRSGESIKVGQLYEVDDGDTLSNIAARFSSSVSRLRDMNADLAGSDTIAPGQLLCVTFNQCSDAPAQGA